MIELKTPINKLTSVGSAISKKLSKINLLTIDDLIFHYPFRYDDYSEVLTIDKIKAKKTGTIKAIIKSISTHSSFNRKMSITEALVSDKTDSLKIIWFNQPYLTKKFTKGQTVYFAGKIIKNKTHGFQLINPSYETPLDNKNPIHTGRLVPIYPLTSNITQKQIRFLIKQTIPVIQKINDWLHRDIRATNNLIDLSFALEQIHFPSDKKIMTKAIKRLKFDELFIIQAKNHLIRQNIKHKQAHKIKFYLAKTKKFVKELPFKLTNAQKRSAWEIINDMGKDNPMNRLLEGDVGSGKTVVAGLAILNVILNSQQTCYMAPTEILAEQHFNTFSNLFKNFSFKIALLTSNSIKTNFKNKKIKIELIKKLAQLDIDLIIGTHALIQPIIKFKKLGLVIIDEQHRFGTSQRQHLLEQTVSPHFLSMTATPIPRSVALTLYGDLDISIIDEMPKGRKKIITKIIKPIEYKKTYEFIKEEITKQKQAFVICPLIDESDKLGAMSVKQEYINLTTNIFPNLKIKALHGKLKSTTKEKIIKDFLAKQIDILVSTTVIEVGIDIKNASIMLIHGAERFGLAQLHQLRGRVGRGEDQSYCFLMLDTDSITATERLNALISTNNGFELAEKDLEIRGPGEIFGTQQSGFITSLKIAKLTDVKIIALTKKIAKQLFYQSPRLEKYPLIKKKIQASIMSTHLE